MTDNTTGTAVGLPPVVTRNIRAELARAGKTVQEAQKAIPIGSSTWDDRMKHPGYWRLHQLQELANWLGVDVAVLLRDAR